MKFQTIEWAEFYCYKCKKTVTKPSRIIFHHKNVTWIAHTNGYAHIHNRLKYVLQQYNGSILKIKP